MTIEEIRKEVFKDFEIVFRKSGYLKEELVKANSPLRGKRIIRIFDYVSKYRNNWLFKLDVDKKGCLHNYMVWYYNDRGLAAIEVFPQQELILYFTTHFFKRYNERLKLNITSPKELLNTFLKQHSMFTFKSLEQVAPGIHKIFAVTESGVALGTQLTFKKCLKMNTFVTHDMLRGTQLEIEAQHKAEIEKYLSSINRLD